MSKRNIIYSLIVLGLITGGYQIAHGAYIYAKAELAQYLLVQAWQQSKRTHQAVKPWSWADTWPVAKLEVSAHNIELIVLAGDTGRTLAFGPGYNLASVRPGEIGNSIISAHRDTHFEFLQRLSLEDEIVVETQKNLTKKFRVIKTEVVDSRSARIDVVSDSALLTLVTCYPFDSIEAGGPLRFVVQAQEITI